jgi:hypothetical protein
MTDTNMTRVKEILYQVLLIAVLFCASCSLAFVPKSTSQAIRHRNTALESLPTMIIGPMIKKMRENQAKKKMPMVDDSEARGQAPGLRVGGNAWKWPPIWPYDQNFFTPNEDIKIPNAPSQMNPMQGMLMGGMQAPNPEIVEPGEGTTVETLNEVQYWSVENANTKTDLDEESATRLTRYVPYDISRFMHLKAPLILSRDWSSSP